MIDRNSQWVQACVDGDIKRADEIKDLKILDFHFLESCEKGDITAFNEFKCSNDVDIIEIFRAYSKTALIEASKNAHPDTNEIISILLKNGADINHLLDGKTALMTAANNGKLSTVDALIKHGADVNHANRKKTTALMFAAYEGHAQVVDALIRHGSDLNSRSDDGLTAFDYASEQKHISVMVLLKPEIMEEMDKGGNTLLIKACKKKDEEAIFSLYDKGADFNLENKIGLSALDVLIKFPKLSERLNTLKDKLIFEKMLDEDDSHSIGL